MGRNILPDPATGAPIFDPHFFSLTPNYDVFQPRGFPLFGKGKKK